MKSRHVIFVHGLFGWGPGELGGLGYWGNALAQFEKDFTVHEACCGPVSSYHDRACEVFAQLKGTQVDYGKAHSLAEGHRQTSTDFESAPLVEHWSEENPVILIGHSAGAQTCMQLQQLLADDYWGCGSNARWVEAIVSVAGVMNGSTLSYMFGCDRRTGLLSRPLGEFIGKSVQVIDLVSSDSLKKVYDFKLGQWLGKNKPGGIDDLVSALEASRFAKGRDNLAFDLSLQGCAIANGKFVTQPDTYYLAIVTSQSRPGVISNNHVPERQMNPLLVLASVYQGGFSEFDEPPIAGWGGGDLVIEKWKENDGAVSSISTRYPFTAGNHPVGGEGIFHRTTIEKGKWYWERAEKSTGRRFDHVDAVFAGGRGTSTKEAHKALYKNLCARLKNL